jgi:hypothetical protein
LEAWPLCGTLRAANFGRVDIYKMAAAKGRHFNPAVETQQPLFDRSFQNQVGAAVSQQYFRNRTMKTVFRPPLWRARVLLYQTTFLYLTTPL